MRRWSREQYEAIKHIATPENCRFTLLVGDIGTGKTAAAMAAFLIWSGRYRNCIFGLMSLSYSLGETKLMREVNIFCGEHGLRLPVVKRKRFKLGRNEYMILSGINARQAAHIQGLSLQGAFVDEVTTIDHEVLAELNNRLRVGGLAGAKMVMTANPASPSNKYGYRFKKDWYDRRDEIGMEVMILTEGANPAAPVEFYDSQRLTGTAGSRARRLGGGTQWVADSGLVYPEFYSPEPAPQDGFTRYGIGADCAVSSITHAILFGFHEASGVWWALNEWRHDGRQNGQLPFRDQCFRIKSWLKGLDIDPEIIVYDSANPGFGIELSRALKRQVGRSRKDVMSAISKTRLWLENGYMRLSDGVSELVDELVALSWDENWAERGEDKPTKGSDHGCDALKDFIYTLAEVR